MELKPTENEVVAQDPKHFIDPGENQDQDSIKSDDRVEEHDADS